MSDSQKLALSVEHIVTMWWVLVMQPHQCFVQMTRQQTIYKWIHDVCLVQSCNARSRSVSRSIEGRVYRLGLLKVPLLRCVKPRQDNQSAAATGATAVAAPPPADATSNKLQRFCADIHVYDSAAGPLPIRRRGGETALCYCRPQQQQRPFY